MSEYTSRADVTGSVPEESGEDGVHAVPQTQHRPTEETPAEREAREAGEEPAAEEAS